MLTLFMLVIIVGLVETAAQYCWLGMYFSVGIPLRRIRVVDDNSLLFGEPQNETARSNKFTTKWIGEKRFAIRQARFGAARYAYMHAVGTVVEPNTCVVMVFMDFNVLFVGGFFGTLAGGETAVSCFFGVVTAWLLCRYFVDIVTLELAAKDMLRNKEY